MEGIDGTIKVMMDQSFNMTLSKYGKGVINAERNYNVDKKHGIVVY